MPDWLRNLARKGLDKLQDTFPPNRVVILLTPFFAAAAAAFTGWLMVQFPQLPPFDPGVVAGGMGLAAASAVGGAYTWLRRHIETQRINDVLALSTVVPPEQLAATAAAVVGSPSPAAAPVQVPPLLPSVLGTTETFTPALPVATGFDAPASVDPSDLADDDERAGD